MQGLVDFDQVKVGSNSSAISKMSFSSSTNDLFWSEALRSYTIDGTGQYQATAPSSWILSELVPRSRKSSEDRATRRPALPADTVTWWFHDRIRMPFEKFNYSIFSWSWYTQIYC